MTITQAIRPYLEHVNRADLAVERARTDGPFGPDVDGAENAHACAFAHAQLAAKRARDALAAPCVEPLLDPSWVGTVNLRPRPSACSWRNALTMHHLKRLLAIERENAVPDVAMASAREVAVTYRLKLG